MPDAKRRLEHAKGRPEIGAKSPTLHRCIRALQALFSVPLSQQRRCLGEPLVSTTRPCGRARVAAFDGTAQGPAFTP